MGVDIAHVYVSCMHAFGCIVQYNYIDASTLYQKPHTVNMNTNTHTMYIYIRTRLYNHITISLYIYKANLHNHSKAAVGTTVEPLLMAIPE